MVSADALRWSLVSTRVGVWTVGFGGAGRTTRQPTVRILVGQTLSRFLLLPLLLALTWIPIQAGPEQYEGKTIAGIQFEPEKQPLTKDQLLAMIPLRAGQPLRAADVRDARKWRRDSQAAYQAEFFHWSHSGERSSRTS